MMKKNLLVILVLSTALLLSGCSASSSDSASMSTADAARPESTTVTTTTTTDSSSGYSSGDITQYTDGLKLVYNGEMTLETTDFESIAQSLADLVGEYGGYYSNSTVNQYGSGYRFGEYTIRIPAEYYEVFHQSVGELCLMTRDQTTTEDISATYYDTQGRLETQQIKLDRLQALLEQAENMEDLITIEAAISDTQWQIDNLSGEMSYYNSIVDYATIDIYLNEVYQLSNVQDAPKTFVQRMGNSISEGTSQFLENTEDLVVSLAYNWITLVIIVAIAFCVVKVRPNVKNAKLLKKSKKESNDDTTK